jgi:beta-lactamase regulating signal transducer with metallopeptidase domain
MINIVGTLGQSLFSGFCMLILASMLSALLYPAFQIFNQRLSIENQTLTTLYYTLIAPLSVVLAIVVLTHPAIAATVVYAHCHDNSCAPHVPAPVTSSSLGAVLVALAVVIALIVVYFMSRTLQSARRRQMYLDALSKPSKQVAKHPFAHYRLIESEDLVAWCAGFLFPVIYVSTGLVKKLTKLQLHAVLAHEYGHVARRDNLRKLLLNWVSAFWLPKIRDSLRQQFSSQMEQLADRDSATITGQGELVKQIYAMLHKPHPRPTAIYQHRDILEPVPEVSFAPRFFFTGSVYVFLVVMFVLLTVSLTIATHGLLEHV